MTKVRRIYTEMTIVVDELKLPRDRENGRTGMETPGPHTLHVRMDSDGDFPFVVKDSDGDIVAVFDYRGDAQLFINATRST